MQYNIKNDSVGCGIVAIILLLIVIFAWQINSYIHSRLAKEQAEWSKNFVRVEEKVVESKFMTQNRYRVYYYIFSEDSFQAVITASEFAQVRVGRPFLAEWVNIVKTSR